MWVFLTLVMFLVMSADSVDSSASAKKRPLWKPDFDLCQTRPDTVRFGTHRYLLSWTTNSSDGEQKLDWIASRNFCRKRSAHSPTKTCLVTKVFSIIVVLKLYFVHEYMRYILVVTE